MNLEKWKILYGDRLVMLVDVGATINDNDGKAYKLVKPIYGYKGPRLTTILGTESKEADISIITMSLDTPEDLKTVEGIQKHLFDILKEDNALELIEEKEIDHEQTNEEQQGS